MDEIVRELKDRHMLPRMGLRQATDCPPLPAEAQLSAWEVCSMCLRRRKNVLVYARFTCSGNCGDGPCQWTRESPRMCGDCDALIPAGLRFSTYCGFCAGPLVEGKVRGHLPDAPPPTVKPQLAPAKSGWFGSS